MKTIRKFKPNNTYMGRFAYGSDIHESLEVICAEHNIRAAWINVIGALSEAAISYYDQETHEYFTRELKGEYEIVSCSGNISIKDEKPFAHIHIVLSDTDYNTVGGHLMPGSVKLFAGEFVIFELDKLTETDEDLVRCMDAKTGLALW